MKLWKARGGDEDPGIIEVECPKGRYPACDADGETIFDNTHFDTEAEAWERLAGDAAAGLSMTTGHVVDLRTRLAKAEREVVDAAVFNELVRTRRAAREARR